MRGARTGLKRTPRWFANDHVEAWAKGWAKDRPKPGRHAQKEGLMHWTIGTVKISLVREHYQASPLEVMYVNADSSVLQGNIDWLRPYLRDDGLLLFSVHSLVIDNGEQVILVDTCNGTHQTPEANFAIDLVDYLPALAAAGYRPEDIDVVLCTHLHDDHIGWNTRMINGQWVPTFPNARYLVSRIEHEFAQTDEAQQSKFGFCPRSSFAEAITPVAEAGLLDLVATDHRINPQVWIEAAPGHSPGHVVVHIESEGKRAVCTGDAIHHPIQFAAPHWQMFLDTDPELGVRTRVALMERAVDEHIQVFGAHFGASSCGFVSRRDDRSYHWHGAA